MMQQPPELTQTSHASAQQPPVPMSMGSAVDSAGDGERYSSARIQQGRWAYVAAISASILTTLIALPLLRFLDLANIAMLFLLTVVLVAIKFGRGPGVVATCVGIACLDFFFVAPRFSFAVNDFQYVVTFAVMLAVGIITGQLTAGLRYQARIAAQRESRSQDLYEFARELSGALQTEQIIDTTRNFIQRTFHTQAVLLLPGEAGRLQLPHLSKKINPEVLHLSVLDMAAAQWAFDHTSPSGSGTDTLASSGFSFLPLVAPMRARGVLAIRSDRGHAMLVSEQRQQLLAYAALAAIALERVHYVEVAQDALVRMESERLRNSLLSALSHDLRTPLTSLIGLSESLAMSKPSLSDGQMELTDALHDEALRMNNLVANLLDMARIQSGKVHLNLQWQYVEEVVGSALRASRSSLARHEVHTRHAHNLPLVRYDAVLLERVLCNLVENAAKYTPPGSRITVAAKMEDDFLAVEVYDNGPGLPPGREEIIFEKFVRGERESSLPGVGLGLAICRAIIEAHGGAIRAGLSTDGGACIHFTLPLATPPAMPDMDDDQANISSATP